MYFLLVCVQVIVLSTTSLALIGVASHVVARMASTSQMMTSLPVSKMR